MHINKKNYTNRIHFLLALVGVSIVIIAILIKEKQPNASTLLLSIGGIFFAHGLSWMIEEYFKKRDERLDASDMLHKIYITLENTMKPKVIPKEKYIKIFRENPLYFYYQTSAYNEVLWNCIELDFSDNSNIGRMTTSIQVYDKKKEKNVKYAVEMYRTFTHDNIIIVFRTSDDKSRASICILPCLSGKNDVHGFLYHDNWSGDWILSPAILSFNKKHKTSKGQNDRLNKKFTSYLSDEEAESLKNEWKKKHNSHNLF